MICLLSPCDVPNTWDLLIQKENSELLIQSWQKEIVFDSLDIVQVRGSLDCQGRAMREEERGEDPGLDELGTERRSGEKGGRVVWSDGKEKNMVERSLCWADAVILETAEEMYVWIYTQSEHPI